MNGGGPAHQSGSSWRTAQDLSSPETMPLPNLNKDVCRFNLILKLSVFLNLDFSFTVS